MPDLHFQVESAEAQKFAATPLLNFKLRVTDAETPADSLQATTIHSVLLRCQIRIEPTRRRYEPQAQERLADLFGEPHRWGQTVRSLLWTHANLSVPPFSGSTVVDLPVPCSFDLNAAATKYFYALEEGEIPLCLLFSGTIFHAAPGGLQVAPISWEKEADFRLPVRVWRDMMDLYYPNSAWLCLQREVFDRLYSYKCRHGLPTWEQALDRLLTPLDEQVTT